MPSCHNYITYHHHNCVMLLQARLCLNIVNTHIFDGKEKSLAVAFKNVVVVSLLIINELLFKKYDQHKALCV